MLALRHHLAEAVALARRILALTGEGDMNSSDAAREALPVYRTIGAGSAAVISDGPSSPSLKPGAVGFMNRSAAGLS